MSISQKSDEIFIASRKELHIGDIDSTKKKTDFFFPFWHPLA